MSCESNLVRAHVWIYGRVQGVCFRMFTCDEAVRLGLDGWVRNLPDGRVEAVFEGDREKVELAVSWCRHGPRHATVTDIEVQWDKPGKNLTGFRIRS